MSNSKFSVTVEHAFDGNDNVAVLIKLQARIVEVNIYIPVAEIHQLLAFHSERQVYCCVGESANSRVHWSRADDSEVYVLIGDGQEVWDVGLAIDEAMLDEISVQVRQLLGSEGT